MIREYATEVIAKEGYHNTTIQMIAKQANISVGTIYNYFKNKEEILEYIFEFENKKRIDFIEGLDENLEFIDKIISILENHFRELEKHPNTCKVLVQEYSEVTRYSRKVQDTCFELQRMIQDIIIDAQVDGGLRKYDPELMASVIIHTFRSVIYYLHYKRDQVDFDIIKKQIVEFIFNGFKV